MVNRSPITSGTIRIMDTLLFVMPKAGKYRDPSPPRERLIPWNSDGGLRWTRDGRMLTILLWKGVFSSVNIWGQPVSGGPLRQLTHFPDKVLSYDWSPDGKQLVITRSSPTADVVLISKRH